VDLIAILLKKEIYMKTYSLIVDYDEFVPETYRGVCILDFSLPKEEREIIRVCTGSVELDTKRAIKKLEEIMNEEEGKVIYLSSYDNYLSDLELSKDPEMKHVYDKYDIK
jgi:hypothetical protein